MTIYDREKMKQLPVYPTKQTPSYADWRLFEMGADLEDKVDSIPASEPYTAGSGIAISEENIISNTAQPDVTKAYVDGVDVNLQQQIDAIVASSDVKDIVGTYAELQAYDTSTLGNNDIVKVLVDSTHSDAMGYYRWVITGGVGAWSYIGSEGPYYTKSQVDTELNDKLDKDFSNADVGQATAGQVLVVNSSANGVEFANQTKELPTIVSGDAGKVLTVNSGETGVEWQSIVAGGGYEYVSGDIFRANLDGGYYQTKTVAIDSNYDYIAITSTNNAYAHVSNNYSNVGSSSIDFVLTNKSNTNRTIEFRYDLYRRPKVGNNNIINVIGCIGKNCIFIPEGGSATQVFKKTGSNYAQGSWQTLKEVPSSSASDIGKVLGVTAANTYGWVTAGGSGGKVSVSSTNDLSSGDIFIGTIADTGLNTYNIIGIVKVLINTEIEIISYTKGSPSYSDLPNRMAVNDIIEISGYKI